jgi:tetratricopeptide (TPR) repeat protein
MMLLAARPVAAAPPPDPWPLLFGAEPRTPPLAAPLEAVCREPARVAVLGASIQEAKTGADRVRARARLAQEMLYGEDEPVRACAALASARLALELGLHPEASADALECSRQAEQIGDASLVAAARFVRAEAFFFAGRREDAASIFEELAKASDPRLAAAARLRIADAQLEQGEVDSALAAFRELLGPDSPLLGVPLGAFALRAAEAAWSAGEAGEAARWVEQALGEKLAPPHWIAASLRRADLLVAAGRRTESDEQLAAVVAFERGGSAELLTRVRRAARLLADPSCDRAQIEELLRPAIASANLPLSSYARSIQVAASLAAHEPEAGFRELVPLLMESRSVARLGLAQQLDEVLAALLEDPDRCVEAVARVDAQRALIARMASRGEPLAALGDCYQRLGLVEPALAILRAVVQRFGPEAAALPFARASLRAGFLDVAESAVRDRLAANVPDRDAWTSLLAEVELARHDPVGAAELLVPLVEHAAERERTRAVVLLAQAAGSGLTTGATVEVLAAAILAQGDAAWSRSGGALADAALGTANLLRRAGRVPSSLALYALASERATRPTTRAEALYWRGRLAPSHAEARTRLRAATSAGGGAWSELARSRVALLDLGRRPSGADPG